MRLKPSKIICVGLNYRDHAEELKLEIPEFPLIFLKPPTTVIGDGEEIIYPDWMTHEVHYEAELGIVIKREAHRVSEEKAAEYIEGFTCGNDVTARDLQRLDGQWTRAKSFDTFCPLGPKVVPLNPDHLDIKLYLNDEIKQAGNTRQMIFKPSLLVSFISSVMTLLPGDVILTGTPPGVGPMKKWDRVAVEIEGIGRLTNYVR
ncbi:fumarylacetoacetate hydrolase family protein [Candidatus Saganbacteria bacterium]|nr:fumarylacetoacetate hydrolase family protein [Candidatus Saganbacteria bacterium]